MKWRNHIPDALTIGGSAAATLGAWMITPPLVLLVWGVFAVCLGLLLEFGRGR